MSRLLVVTVAMLALVGRASAVGECFLAAMRLQCSVAVGGLRARTWGWSRAARQCESLHHGSGCVVLTGARMCARKKTGGALSHGQQCPTRAVQASRVLRLPPHARFPYRPCSVAINPPALVARSVRGWETASHAGART